jgi:hypothetical protein
MQFSRLFQSIEHPVIVLPIVSVEIYVQCSIALDYAYRQPQCSGVLSRFDLHAAIVVACCST